MKKNTHNTHSLTIHRIILSILLLFGCAMTFWFVFRGQDAFTILSAEHVNEDTIAVKSTDTTVTMRGSFRARWNNLGAIAFRLNNADTFVSNQVEFSLKEKGSDTWYYTQERAISGPNFRPAFPFGFPLIRDSYDKTYEFQITVHDTHAFSLRNKDEMHFTILTSKYQYPQSELMADTTKLIEFTFNKIINIVSSANFLGFALISFLPALFYIMWKMIRSTPVMLGFLFAGMIAFEIIWMNRVYDFYYVITMLVWLVFCMVYRLDTRVSFGGALIHLLLLPLPLVRGDIIRAEKVSTWAYLFFLGGVLIIIYNRYTDRKKTKQ